jgi:hypothetical protein
VIAEMFFQLKNSEEAPVMGKILEAIPFYDGSGQNDSLFRMHHFSSKCLPDSNDFESSTANFSRRTHAFLAGS